LVAVGVQRLAQGLLDAGSVNTTSRPGGVAGRIAGGQRSDRGEQRPRPGDMAARAADLGGPFDLAPGPAGGTVLTWRVPI
jgi:hypothetical protein